MLITED